MVTTVYLDQNKWIRLLQQQEKHTTDPTTEQVLKTIKETAERREARFCLSRVHLAETSRSSNVRDRRDKLLDLMFTISRMWAIPPRDIVQREEIRQFVKTEAGEEYDIQSRVLGRGIPFMYGGESWKIEGDLDPDMREQLEEFAQSREAAEKVLESDMLERLRQISEPDEDLVDELEQIRESHEEAIANNKHRRRFTRVRYFRDNILPELLWECVTNEIDFDPNSFEPEQYIRNPETATETDELLKRFPESYAYVTLTTSRDIQTQRDIEPNDLNDITSLSIAIPYCDVVVTENMWAHEANQQNLDSICDTVITSDLDDLLDLL